MAEKLDLDCPLPMRLANGVPDALGRCRHFDVAHPEFGKRIDDRVDHDSKGGRRAAFSAGAHPESIGRRRHFAECRRERRKCVGSRHRIIHEAGREQLARPRIVVAIFEQRLAGALGDAAMRLAMQDHRVDRAPDVVDSGVADDIDSTGFRIDLDLADLRAVGKACDR